MVNVLKHQALYSIPFRPKFCFLFFMLLFPRIPSGMENSVDPNQTAPLVGAV